MQEVGYLLLSCQKDLFPGLLTFQPNLPPIRDATMPQKSGRWKQAQKHFLNQSSKKKNDEYISLTVLFEMKQISIPISLLSTANIGNDGSIY